ncbi:PREDICTED: ankyrin repeat domain-containing protein 50-like [Priapulus caudatus]|uniref:Ankyrin repeat domain-containing protein 50-like n=1 Tax=Priapulus caudatus TaxID=37621 RepID=A0ABM1ESF3_PRICU|nr:PREDICTED: ankyrin repeat domain-containing protein 50-like [Priapulus caudatus]
MAASRSGHTDTVTALLGAGANIEHADLHGWTAVLEAAADGHTDIVIALLGAGANIDYVPVNGKGKTVLMHAAISGNTSCVMKLLAKLLATGVRVEESRSNDGWTVLAWAAYRGHASIVTKLLDKIMTWHSEDLQTAYQVAVNRARNTTINDGYRESAGAILAHQYFVSELPDNCDCNIAPCNV